MDDPPWPALQYLNLANNNLLRLPRLPQCTHLRQVYLENNNLGDDQVDGICRLILDHPLLFKLSLDQNLFSVAGPLREPACWIGSGSAPP